MREKNMTAKHFFNLINLKRKHKKQKYEHITYMKVNKYHARNADTGTNRVDRWMEAGPSLPARIAIG